MARSTNLRIEAATHDKLCAKLSISLGVTMKLERTLLAVALCLSGLPGCDKSQADADACGPGAVGAACIKGNLAFHAKTTVALEGPDFLGIVMSTDALQCEGPMTRSSPGKATEKVSRPSSRLELMVDLGKDQAQPGKRYPLVKATTDEEVPKGTSAALIGVPGKGMPLKMVARSGFIAVDAVSDQSVRGTFELAFGVGKHTGTFDARYCTPVPPPPMAPASPETPAPPKPQ